MIELPELPYGYEALEPMMSATTLRTHHDKHHRKYIDVTNELAERAGISDAPLEDIILQAAKREERKLFNNAAQAWNHGFFWTCMLPGETRPGGALTEAIDAEFGGLDDLRSRFLEEGAGHFGSGWVWLAVKDGRLIVVSTHDAETALTAGFIPLLVCDVWEHAYYLDHKNDRAGFLAQWWDRIANWDFAQRQFDGATRRGQLWTYPVGVQAYVPPINDERSFERALEEATAHLDSPPAPGTHEDRRFGTLLERITAYAPEVRAVAQNRSVTQDLDRRIREAAAHRREQRDPPDHPWAPMIGGDLRT
jgi:Fe-Mn family superoxide dismutase